MVGAFQVVLGVYLVLKRKGRQVGWYWFVIAGILIVSLLLVFPTLEGFWW